MANDLNQCNFIGRLGVDPEIRYLPQGGAVANFSIACNWKSKDKDGSEWIKVVAYERLAEVCGEYLKKGSKVFISGKLKTRKWQDQQGVDRYTTEIVANEMQMLDGKQEGQQSAQKPQQQRPSPQQQMQPQRQQPQQGFNQQRQAPPQGYQGQMPQQQQQYADFDDAVPF